MNNYANADTYNAALGVLNIESLYIAARRMTNGFSLRNLIADAIEAGFPQFSNVDIENVEFDEILDSVLDN